MGKLRRLPLRRRVEIRRRLSSAAGENQIVVVLARNRDVGVGPLPRVAGVAQRSLGTAGATVAIASLSGEDAYHVLLPGHEQADAAAGKVVGLGVALQPDAVQVCPQRDQLDGRWQAIAASHVDGVVLVL